MEGGRTNLVEMMRVEGVGGMTVEERELLLGVAAQLRKMVNGEPLDTVPCSKGADPVMLELGTTVNELITSINDSREFVAGLADGNLNVRVPVRNHLVSPFKQLHASLMHLAWQTRRIAEGDYSQRVHFLGDFSTSFNSMVEALAEKERIEESLRIARAEVKQLEGIIPICMYCKKIRNDKDYWEKLENYLTEHSEALFSHGICPECMEKNFGRKK